MKRFIMFVTLGFLLFPHILIADSRCPLVGKTFVFSSPGSKITYKLTDFDCSFGPGCCGTCSLWYGDFTFGPIKRIPLEFSCKLPKDASPDETAITIANLPCFVDANVTKLYCIPINMEDYHKVEFSGKTYYLPKGTNVIMLREE